MLIEEERKWFYKLILFSLIFQPKKIQSLPSLNGIDTTSPTTTTTTFTLLKHLREGFVLVLFLFCFCSRKISSSSFEWLLFVVNVIFLSEAGLVSW